LFGERPPQRQFDPFDRGFSFISSSNNNIGRISLMIRKLCEHLGTPLPSFNDLPHFAFPTPEILAQPGTDETLRRLGFGYRAPYIHRTAQMLCEMAEERQCTPHEYLLSLSKLPYAEAKLALLEFVGVGPKVADCIALFGLGFSNVVPVGSSPSHEASFQSHH
jgi:N-glycosylase/DNA lyase